MGKVAKYVVPFILVTASLIFCELGLRGLLFFDIPWARPLKNPHLYATMSSSDDWWFLRERFSYFRLPAPLEPHPLLGWKGRFDPKTLLHDDAVNVGGKHVVLLYGDSFAACAEEPCFEDILNSDPNFSQKCILLNYGVGGYGQDQIHLLMAKTASMYSVNGKPTIILSLLDDDIDRNLLTFRGARKPYFEIAEKGLALKGVPIGSPEVDAQHPPKIGIYSYLYRFFVYGAPLPTSLAQLLQGEEERRHRIVRLATALVKESAAFMRENSSRNLGVIFSSALSGGGKRDEDADWRALLLERLLREERIPYLSVEWDILVPDMATSHRPQSDYFIPNDGHPKASTNHLIAAHLMERLSDLCGPTSPALLRNTYL